MINWTKINVDTTTDLQDAVLNATDAQREGFATSKIVDAIEIVAGCTDAERAAYNAI